jgi:hypothetical protein
MISYDSLKQLIRESVIILLESEKEKVEEIDDCESCEADNGKEVAVKKAGKRKKKLTWVSGKKKPDPLHHLKGAAGAKSKNGKKKKDVADSKNDEKLQKSVEYLDLEDEIGEDIYDVKDHDHKSKNRQKKNVVEGRYSLLKILN